MPPITRYSNPAASKACATRFARLKRSCKRSSKNVLMYTGTAHLPELYSSVEKRSFPFMMRRMSAIALLAGALAAGGLAQVDKKKLMGDNPQSPPTEATATI